MRAAGTSRFNLCEGHFHIAMTKLAEANRDAAREHFRKSVGSRVITYMEYDWSRAFLSRMDKDPNWPPWIPVKK